MASVRIERRIFILSSSASFIQLASTIKFSLDFLRVQGFPDILSPIALKEISKNGLALIISLSLLSILAIGISLIFLKKRLSRLAAAFHVIGIVLLLIEALASWSLHSSFILAVAFLVVASAILSVSCILSLRMPTEVMRLRILSPQEIASVAIFSALTAVITATTGSLFPSPTGGYTHVGDTVIFIAALIFGSKVGALTGIIGSLGADFLLAYPRWYVSILAHGLEGIIAGLGRNRKLLFQVLTLLAGGFMMATGYFVINVFIKGLPLALISYARDLFGQAGISILMSIPLVKAIERFMPTVRRKSE